MEKGEEIKKEIKIGEQVHIKKEVPKPIKKEDPKKHPEEREPKPIKKEDPKKHPEEREPKPIKKEDPKKHPEPKTVDSKEHMLPPQEELEVMINLCGSKKELIDVLNHINRMVLEAPKKVNSEIKVKKLK